MVNYKSVFQLQKDLQMKLFIEEKFFSLWGGSYNVYYEDRSVAYTVQGQPSFVRRKLSVNDPQGNEVGMLQTKIIAFLPAYTIWKNGQEIGRVQQKFSLLQPKFDVNFKNWRVEGNFMGWNYKVYDEQGRVAATVDQQIWNLTEHFVIETNNDEDALDVLMLTLAISAMRKDQESNDTVSTSD